MKDTHATIAYLGDAAEAAGFRLAGAVAISPAPDEVESAFARALASARVVIVSARCASLLAPARLEAALTKSHPLVLIAPGEPVHPLDPAARVARQLGLETV
jgi:vacuolar-type H+-ATPase subunit F/Vma7